MTGAWNVNITVGKLPQKIATACTGLALLGAEYTPIAYLGSQQVNGVNHAVLAEQVILTGRDTKNIVLLMFNERPEGATISGVERVIESGGALGGMQVNVQTEIPDEARKAFDEAFHGFVGANVVPAALLATQVTKGVNYAFIAEMAPVTLEPQKSAVLVIVNGMTKEVSFVDLLTSKQDVMSLGYAFTWLKSQDTSVSRPANELLNEAGK